VRRLLLSDAAEGDLRAIAEFTEQVWGSSQRRRYLAVLRDRMGALRHRPDIGRPRPEVHRDWRSLLVGRHVAFYRVTEADVVVLRILHSAVELRARPNDDVE
jgi:toxin ParE1/3/4